MDGKKRVRGRWEPPDAEGDQLRGVRGVLRIKSKIGAGGSHFGLPAPSAVCFTQIKGYSDFAMLTCIALGVFLSDRRYASGDCLCKEPCCFFFVGAADENFAAVDEMEGIAHKRKDFRGVYPKLWWQWIKGCFSRVDRSSSGVCRQSTVSWSLTTFV